MADFRNEHRTEVGSTADRRGEAGRTTQVDAPAERGPRAEDLGRLLRELRQAPPSRRMARLWQDMRQRWSAGEPRYVEDYLNVTPDELSEEEVLDLIYGEYALREECEGAPDLEEYRRRFPDQAEALQRQLLIHHSLSAGDPEYDPLGETVSLAPSPSTERRDPPSWLGRYLILAPLGSGGQAQVFRAVHPELGKEVVIKVAQQPLTDPEGTNRQRVLAEGRLLAELQHPNLAPVYDLDFLGDRPYVVMEYVRGRTLQQCAEQEGLSATRSAELAAQLARALAAAHARGVTHRDIKPSNVLLDEDGEPRLIDFGLSQCRDAWSEERDEPGSLLGTLPFMAPEQARGETERIGPRCDIFALGGVLFYLLTGRPPYEPMVVPLLVEEVRAGRWDRAALNDRKIPRRLRRICCKAMAVDPDERYASAEELADDLERFVRSTQSRPGLWTALAAGLLGAGGLALWAALPEDAAGPDPAADEGPQAAAAVFEPSLSVHVWESGRYLDLLNVVPLRNGDELQMRATVPAGLHVSLFVSTSEGELRRLAAYPPSETDRSLRYPAEEQQAVPLSGPPGTELLFLCGDPDGPVMVESLRELWPADGPWPALPDYSVLRLGPREIRVEGRSRNLGRPVDRPDPEAVVRENLERLRQRLAEEYTFFEGLAFAHTR